VRREPFNSILTEFSVSMKSVRLIETCLSEAYSKVCIGKNLMHFLLRMVGNKGMFYHHCFLTLF
jgi:hypothetical protein